MARGVELEREDSIPLGSEPRQGEPALGLEHAALPVPDADAVEPFALRVRGRKADSVRKPEEGFRMVLATGRRDARCGRRVGELRLKLSTGLGSPQLAVPRARGFRSRGDCQNRADRRPAEQCDRQDGQGAGERGVASAPSPGALGPARGPRAGWARPAWNRSRSSASSSAGRSAGPGPSGDTSGR